METTHKTHEMRLSDLVIYFRRDLHNNRAVVSALFESLNDAGGKVM
jgi:hypothetical protein